MRIEFDVWETPTRSVALDAPTDSQVVDIVHKMDGEMLDLFLIVKDHLQYLAIGGGNDGRYMCFTKEGELANGGEVCFNIDMPCCTNVDVALKVGGQWGDFPESMIVSIEDVRKICSYYLQHGTRHPDYQWKRNY